MWANSIGPAVTLERSTRHLLWLPQRKLLATATPYYHVLKLLRSLQILDSWSVQVVFILPNKQKKNTCYRTAAFVCGTSKGSSCVRPSVYPTTRWWNRRRRRRGRRVARRLATSRGKTAARRSLHLSANDPPFRDWLTARTADVLRCHFIGRSVCFINRLIGFISGLVHFIGILVSVLNEF